MSDVKIIAGPKTWIEGDAVQQLKKTAELPGMVRAVGMPDLHPGPGTPVGAAFVSKGRFYPHLVGNDIACGMGLWQTELGSYVKCEDKNLLYEEAPQAYKHVESAVGDLINENIVAASGLAEKPAPMPRFGNKKLVIEFA